jgi:hypothetical protein
MSIFRLAAIDLWRRRAMPAVMVVAIATASSLAIALPLMQAAAAEQGLRSALQSLGTGGNLEIGIDHVGSADDFDRFQDDARAHVRSELGSIMLPGARFARSNQVQGISLNGVELVRDVGDPLPVAVYYEDLERHVTLTSGRWPGDGKAGDGWPAAISEAGAALLGLKAGDLYCMTSVGISRGNPFGLPRWCARIAAVFRPASADDPYWAGQQLGADIALGLSSLFQVAETHEYVTLHANQLYKTDVARVHAADAARIQAGLKRLGAVYGVTSDATFTTGLGDAIRVFLARLDTQRALAVSMGVALLAVTIFAAALAAGHYLESRRRLIGLWRARGGSRSDAWALLLAQLGLLALAAVPLGVALGIGAVAMVSSAMFGSRDVLGGGILVSSLLPFAVAMVATALVLALLAAQATRRNVTDVRRSESEPPAAAWWRQWGLDLLLAAGGLLLIAEYRLQAGDFFAGQGQDPLAVVLPAIALGLVALAALRLLPLISRLVARGPSLGARLARWHLEREPLQHSRVALLLSIALGLSLFTSAYLATDLRNAVDRARYAAGADVRVTFGFGTGPPVVNQAIAATPGVIASSLVYRGEGRPGRSGLSTTVLAIDGYTFPTVGWWRSDLSSSPESQLMSSLVRGDPDGFGLPGQPRSLTVWVYSSGLDASLEAQLRTSAGRPVTARFGNLASQGWSSLQAPLDGFDSADYPLRLRTLALRPTGPRTDGEIALSGLSSGGAVIDDFSAAGGWWLENAGEFGGVATIQRSPRTHQGQPAIGMQVNLTNREIDIHPKPAAAPLPGVMSSATARSLGLTVGQSFPLHIETNDIDVRLVGLTDYFPTLYPGQDDFLLVPLESLSERLRVLSAYVYPNEAWMDVSGPTTTAARTAELATNAEGHSIDRDTLEGAALNSPLRLSLDAALVMGFLAAFAMVVIGFGLHFLAIARGRVSESAIMQANGLPWRVVDQGLLAEQVVVLCHGVVVGAALGGLLAAAILPVIQTSVLPADTIPPTIVTVDPRILIVAAVALLAGAALVGQLAMRSAGRFRLHDELRAIA